MMPRLRPPVLAFDVAAGDDEHLEVRVLRRIEAGEHRSRCRARRRGPAASATSDCNSVLICGLMRLSTMFVSALPIVVLSRSTSRLQERAEHAAAADVEAEVDERDAGEVERQLARRGIDAGLNVGGDLERVLPGVVEVLRRDVHRARAAGADAQKLEVVVEVERHVHVELGVDMHDRVVTVADAGGDLVFAVGRRQHQARLAAGGAAAGAVAAGADVGGVAAAAGAVHDLRDADAARKTARHDVHHRADQLVHAGLGDARLQAAFDHLIARQPQWRRCRRQRLQSAATASTTRRAAADSEQ